MPRFHRGAALVLIALLLATPGFSAIYSFNILTSAATLEAGISTPVLVTATGAADHTVHLFAGVQNGGRSKIEVGGVKIALNLGEVFHAGTGVHNSRGAVINATVPHDHDLIGHAIVWVAVVVNADGRPIAIAQLGGPIIEDAIC